MEKHEMGCGQSRQSLESGGGQNCPGSSVDTDSHQSTSEGGHPAAGAEESHPPANDNSPMHGDSLEQDSRSGANGMLSSGKKDEENADMKTKYMASMVLSGVGDALGYHAGHWEFEMDGKQIHRDLAQLGGLEKLSLEGSGWIVSDDTVMHLATAEALEEFGNGTDLQDLYRILTGRYIQCMSDMKGRAPGRTTVTNIDIVEQKNISRAPFSSRAGGCGAAMRAMCIGLRYPRPEDLDNLTAVSIESGRVTHHSPTGYLGAFASALFTSYAVQQKPLVSWGKELVSELERAKAHIIRENDEVKENLGAWSFFEDSWKEYLKIKGIEDGKSEPEHGRDFDVEQRDKFYEKLSFKGWGGASGHDAPMIAYDALLASKDNWTELCLRGMLHGGDNDSTGAIAGAWFGALYGFKGVPETHYKRLEYRQRMETLGKSIHALAS